MTFADRKRLFEWLASRQESVAFDAMDDVERSQLLTTCKAELGMRPNTKEFEAMVFVFATLARQRKALAETEVRCSP